MRRKSMKPDQIESVTSLAVEYSDALDKLVLATSKLIELLNTVEKLRLRRDRALLSALTGWQSFSTTQQAALSQLVRAVGDKTARDILHSVSNQASDIIANGQTDVLTKTPNSNEERK